jgi:aminopeptidase N
MRAIFITLILSLLGSTIFSQGSYKPDPNVDVIHYEFNIAVNDSNDVISGRTIISLRFSALSSAVSLDLKNIASSGKGMSVTSVTLNGQAAKWSHQNNRLTVQTEGVVKPGDEALIEIVYSGIPADGLIISKNKFGDRTFFSDNWPDRASNYIPTVNHPSDKATVDFIITAPSHYKVVGSGYLVEESELGKGTRLTHWKEDVPLPVKVMAFGAADFATRLAGEVKGIPVWTWVYHENRKEGFYDYAMAVRPLAFYDSLIGPYSYEKLANVQSKTIFGGLENAGCIFYSENSVTGQGRAESLLAHEISHQWFGNSVTEESWHHIWLSEGFATYLTSVYMEKTYSKEKLAERMKSDRDRVIRYYDRTPAPVIDTTITDLMKLLSTNSYQKGGWVLHMLRQEVGDEPFFNGLRLFYSHFRNKNALTADFRKVMEEVSGKNLEKFFYQWLYVAGQPELKITSAAGKKKGTIDITIEQTQDYLFSFDLELKIAGSGGESLKRVPVNSKKTVITVPGETNAEIIPDPGIKLLFRYILK